MKRYPASCLVLILCAALVSQQCGKEPGPFPPQRTGNIRIVVMDTTRVDSVSVELDDVALGRQDNPTLLPSIVIGLHSLFVYDGADACTVKTVDVLEGRTSEAWFWLTSIGPYPGQTAPPFSEQDVNGNAFSLEGLRNRAVLLAFFEFS